ncbi:MAG: phosphate/phosphite/phosphonate ABC transporter substrate-binding protein [Opitutae bacterium]|nr:phosphate/phosphite/phosphonate ABC transporter substrate-binding protein [Opitutae bacterium]
MLAILAWGSLSAGCGRTETVAGPVYSKKPPAAAATTIHFAIHPLHNPRKLVQSYQPLVARLNARIPGMALEVEASRDYQEFERKIAAREPEILLPNPWQTLEAMKTGYRVIAMAGEPQDFKGLLIVRRDSGIERLEDLRGRSIAYPSATALAACIMPQWLLHEHGIDVNRDVLSFYVGSQESAIMNAFLRRTVAGATWPPPWRAFVAEHPAEAAQLRVAWETESLVNNSVMVRDDVDPALAEQVRRELIDLANSDEGRAILRQIDASRFLPAGDADYDRVREFVARFEAQVRPVKGGVP